MEKYKIWVLNKLWIILCLAIFGCKSAQNTVNSSLQHMIIVPGVGFDDVKIGETTLEEIQIKFGKGYKKIHPNKSSTIINYKKKGISFFYCQTDSNQTLFSINFSQPFMGKTTDDIYLYTSSMTDVIEKYGAPNWTTSNGSLTWDNEYNGISFLIKRDRTLRQYPFKEEKHINKKIIEIKVNNGCQCWFLTRFKE
jgi:hypothetical protein